MDYEIVPMSSQHIGGILKIEETCFSSPWSRENLESELTNDSAHFLAAQGPEVMGYIGVNEIAGEAYITNIAVLPEFRRKGIAEALLGRACEDAEKRECEFITLEVRSGNAPAIALYEKLGFEKAGMRKNFYSDPAEDGVIYTKRFRGEI